MQGGALAAQVTNDGNLTFSPSALQSFSLSASVAGAGTLTNNANATLASTNPAVTIANAIVNNGSLSLASGTYLNTLVNTGTLENFRTALANVTNTGLILAAPDGATFAQNLSGAGGAIRYHNLGQRILIAGNLSGSQTFDHLEVNLATQQADTLAILGNATGAHTLRLLRADATPAGATTADPATFALPLVTIAAGDATFTTPDRLNDGMTAYGLLRGDGGALLANTNQWYLTAVGQSATADLVLSTAAILGADWHYSLDSLYQRLGDLHTTTALSSSSGGVHAASLWLRTNAYRLNAAPALAGDTFRQDTYNLTAGADHALSHANSPITLYAGGYLQTGHSSRTYDGDDGSSDTTNIAAGLYATAMHETGWYADLTVKYARYTNHLDATAPVSTAAATTRYNNTAAGASLELGRRLTNRRLWLEPSIQTAVALINGATYTTDQNMTVRLDNSTAWQTRLQLRAGATLAQWTPYIKFAEVRGDTTGGALHVEDATYTPNYNAWRFETGFGVSYFLTPRDQLYFDYEYAQSPLYARPWALNLGYRHSW